MQTTETDTKASIENVRGSRIPSLTGMRWIAVLLVFIYHSAGGIFPTKAFGENVTFVTSRGGWVGVSFFFVLSGFVLAWSMRSDDTAKRFWRRRFFKIYPNHVVAALLAVCLMLWTGTQIVYVVPNLLLVQAWVPDPDVFLSVNGVSWSLSCEALFYLSFPLWISLIRKIRPERLWYWVGGMVLAILVVPLLARLLPATPLLAWEPHSMYRWWFVYFLPPVRVLDFVLGILLARVVLSGRWIPVKLWMAAAACVAGYVASLYVPYLYQYDAATIIPIALLIPTAAMADVRGRGSVLGHPVMVWLGNVSFAFYLLHRLILAHLVYLTGQDYHWTFWPALALVGAGLVISILLSWALYSWVERPVQRRFSVRRRPVPVPA